MQDLFISINNNKVRVSAVDQKAGFKFTTEELTESVLNDQKVTDMGTFSSILSETISKVTSQPKSRLLLNFIIEPQDVYLRFFTLKKGSTGDGEAVVSEIKKMLDGVNLEDLYFSYQKIAPFLYQFIGVRKDTLENYIEISNTVGIGLKSVIPWVMLLPKYTESTQPTIFVARRDDKQVIALSELNGIFFSGVYDKERTSKELQDFVNQVSAFYKTNDPIQYVYTLNYNSASFGDYKVTAISLPVSDLSTTDTEGFEINVLTNYMCDKDAGTISGQANLVNLLPVPAVVKKTSVLVYAGSIIVGLGLVGSLVFFGILKRPVSTDANLAMNSNQEQNVLSESNTAVESSNTAQVETKTDLKKSDLKIRVENGAGVSGLAAKTSDFLKELGYNVVNIDTADEERKDTLLRFKKSSISFKDLVINDSKEKFPDAVVEDTLANDAEYDLLIVIGGNANL